MDDLVKKLNDGTYTVDDITDSDIRQLVIYYATIIRSYNDIIGDRLPSATAVGQTILNAWDNMPRELWSRFRNMILSSSPEDQFWVRPAETNIKFGVKISVEPVDTAE